MRQISGMEKGVRGFSIREALKRSKPCEVKQWIQNLLCIGCVERVNTHGL